jgi:hypothetical protein
VNKYKWLPSEPTDEMKLAMANAFIASLNVAQEEGYDLTDTNTCSTILGFIFEQGWLSAPDVEQEPVAMLFSLSGKLGATTAKEYALDIDPNAIPLYTQPKREPLSRSELKQIFEQSIGLKYWDFAKAIEEAHGIGRLTYKPITHK